MAVESSGNLLGYQRPSWELPDADGVHHQVKGAAGDVPVFVNTGVRAHNAEEQLSVADGAVIGTFFKKDGVFENEVDRTRVEELMNVVKGMRTKA